MILVVSTAPVFVLILVLSTWLASTDANACLRMFVYSFVCLLACVFVLAVSE